jgi:hypothetical protein
MPHANTLENEMKYKGPAKPLPTHIEIVSDKAERLIFLLLAIFMAVYLYLE